LIIISIAKVTAAGTAKIITDTISRDISIIAPFWASEVKRGNTRRSARAPIERGVAGIVIKRSGACLRRRRRLRHNGESIEGAESYWIA
jgi:hypothetical protein